MRGYWKYKESLCFTSSESRGIFSDWSVIFSGPEPDATDGLRFQFHHLLAAETITCFTTSSWVMVRNRKVLSGMEGCDMIRWAMHLMITLLNQVVQPASVAEILITLGSGFRNQSVQFLVRFGSKLEIAFLQETVRHFYQLVRIVIVKVELERETFLQAGWYGASAASCPRSRPR